jgi:hypothetical protein
MAAVAYPLVSNFYRSVAEEEARWDLIEVGRALKRYQLDHGQWPPSLDRLVPEFIESLPRDPVTGTLPHDALEGGQVTLATLDWDETGDPVGFEQGMVLSP